METSEVPQIVVIEDEPLLLETITKRFDSKGFSSVGFPSAENAIDYLDSLKKPEELPKVIWLDYYLGNMGGTEFVENIKKKPLLTNIPILVISNGAGEEKVKKLLELGVKKYLLKANYKLDDLISLVQEFT